MGHKHFHLDKIKIYLDKVLSEEKYLNSYSKCADDVYKVLSEVEWITLRNVESWLRGNKMCLETNPDKIKSYAKDFAVSISSLTQGKNRTEKDVYYWALASAIWIYGGMGNINPYYKNKYKSY